MLSVIWLMVLGVCCVGDCRWFYCIAVLEDDQAVNWAHGRTKVLQISMVRWCDCTSSQQLQCNLKQTVNNRKQKTLDILARARRSGMEISCWTSLDAKHWAWLASPSWGYYLANTNIGRLHYCLPLWRKITWPFCSSFLFPLMYYFTSVQAIR